MIDWVAIWLTGKAAAFVFRPVLEELAKEVTRDWIKDFGKNSLKAVFQRKDQWATTIGKAVAEFLDQFEQELVGAGQDDARCSQYTDSLTEFTRNPQVRLAIGNIVSDPSADVDCASLKCLWGELKLRELPEDFHWHKLCRRYCNKVRAMIRELPDVRATLDSHNI